LRFLCPGADEDSADLFRLSVDGLSIRVLALVPTFSEEVSIPSGKLSLLQFDHNNSRAFFIASFQALEERLKAKSNEAALSRRTASQSSPTAGSGLFPSSPYSFSAPSSPMGRKRVDVWKNGEASDELRSSASSWFGDPEIPSVPSSPKAKSTRVDRVKDSANRPASAGALITARSRGQSLATNSSSEAAVHPRRHSSVAKSGLLETSYPLRSESPLVRKLKAEFRI
jgi:hypothetical protein